MFIHDAILESVTCGDTQIAATNLRMKLVRMKRYDNKNESHGFQYQVKVYLNVGVMWYGVVTLDYLSCRFWSRFLPTLKRFTAQKLKATQRGIAVKSSFLVSSCATRCCPNHHHVYEGVTSTYIESHSAMAFFCFS